MQGDRQTAREVGSQKRTPTGLIVLLALLGSVAVQTLQTTELPAAHSSLALSVNQTAKVVSRRVKRVHNSSRRNNSKPKPSWSNFAIPTYPKDIARKKIPLAELAKAGPRPADCVYPQEWVENKVEASDTNWTQRIPLYIHQTSRFRCIHNGMVSVMTLWKNLPQYQYYFHDDVALWRLLDQPWPEFPHLHTILRCLKGMTAVSDIWRLLVLWEYGGIYVDSDSGPNSWTPSSILPDDDAYFVVEFYDAPSQYFMAATPRHPLVYNTIHRALWGIVGSTNTKVIDASMVTGPFALLDGFSLFMQDVGQYRVKPISGGYYVGRNNRSVRIAGFGRARSDEIIKREQVRRDKKVAMYAAANMTHFLAEKKAGRKSPLRPRSCLAVAYDLVIGPPEWYVPSAMEDRSSVAGIS